MRIILSVVLAILSLSSAAQEIVGLIKNEKKEAVINATVQVYVNNVLKGGCVTSHEGGYLIEPLEPGNYDLLVTAAGYDSITIGKVQVAPQGRTTMNFSIQKHSDVPAVRTSRNMCHLKFGDIMVSQMSSRAEVVAIPPDIAPSPALHATEQKVNAHALSLSDSLLLNRYLDSLNHCSLFSQKYQHYFDSALAIKPWKASWWQQKAMPLYKQHKYEAGAPYLDSAVKYDTHHYIDYRAFMTCIFQKNYRAAIKDFEASKTIIGAGVVMDHTYDFYLGLCYLQLNRLDSAQYYLTQSIESQRAANGETWVHFLDLFYLGIVYYEREDYTQAVEVFDRSLALYKNFSDVKYYKACCLKRMHRDEEALVVMTEGQQDAKQGYTINEDNVIYEAYPYQITKDVYYSNAIEAFKGKRSK